MKNKGFTLVELLAVIAVLGIVMVLALPTMLKAFNLAKKELRNYQGVGLEDAARMYVNEIDNETADYTLTEDFKSFDNQVYTKGQTINGYDFKYYIHSKQGEDDYVLEGSNETAKDYDTTISIPVTLLVAAGYYNKGCNYEAEKNGYRTNSDGSTVKYNERKCIMSDECVVTAGLTFEKQNGYLVTKKVNIKLGDKCVNQY